MDVFEIVRMFGPFPSGVLAGIGLGLVWEGLALLRWGRVMRFLTDLGFTLLFWFAVFTFSVGAVGEVRYFTLIANGLGLWAERMTLGRLLGAVRRSIVWLVKRAGVIDLMSKIWGNIRVRFVTNAENQ